MDIKNWRERISHRNDITSRITHLTNGGDDDEAFKNLISILDEKKIHGGKGYVNGTDNVVCLQEAPLNSIAENLIYEKFLQEEKNSNRCRYRAFGLRFIKVMIYRQGGRPVIYGKASELKNILPKSEWWRIVDLQLEEVDNIVDWSHEREWRIKGDLQFQYQHTEVIVPSKDYYKKFIEYFTKNNKYNVLSEINGIIKLDSIYF